MSKTLFTSDLHFFHKNIVAYTNRGNETSQKDHDEWLINLWNSTVADEDTVYHLGDFAFHSGFNQVSALLDKLRGRQIYMLKGNHDEAKTYRELLKNGNITDWWDYREIKIGGVKTILFHFPISSWYGQGRGSYHLHGHCHGNLKPWFSQGLILDVGLDNYYNIYGKHGFFTEQQIIEFMQHKQLFVADHHGTDR